VSGFGTIAAANVVPENRPPNESFIVVSMYARWMAPHPITGSPWSVGPSDVSALIGHEDPSKHRNLAGGDLNMIYGANAGSLSLQDRLLQRTRNLHVNAKHSNCAEYGSSLT